MLTALPSICYTVATVKSSRASGDGAAPRLKVGGSTGGRAPPAWLAPPPPPPAMGKMGRAVPLAKLAIGPVAAPIMKGRPIPAIAPNMDGSQRWVTHARRVQAGGAMNACAKVATSVALITTEAPS